LIDFTANVLNIEFKPY